MTLGFLERDHVTNVTTLTGQLTGESYHVVTARTVLAEAILDGFVVKLGDATEAPTPVIGSEPTRTSWRRASRVPRAGGGGRRFFRTT